jgi:hypothetical protein
MEHVIHDLLQRECASCLPESWMGAENEHVAVAEISRTLLKNTHLSGHKLGQIGLPRQGKSTQAHQYRARFDSRNSISSHETTFVDKQILLKSSPIETAFAPCFFTSRVFTLPQKSSFTVYGM